MSQEWSGRKVAEARAWVDSHRPRVCWKCDQPLKPGQPWVVGHRKSRSLYPELTWDPTNWERECRPCSDGSGTSVVRENAAVAALVAAGVDRDSAADFVADGALFPAPRTPREPGPLPVSPPGVPIRPRITASYKAAPAAGTRKPLEIRDALAWDPDDRLRAVPWLAEFADVPEDAAPPLAMTPPHPDAVCSYGWDGCTHLPDGEQIVRWAREQVGVTLRWWQRLAVVRQHEHRADGEPCWAEVIESAPRRAGKSVRIRTVALWRLSHAAVIGEVQNVIHCGNDLPICREIQRGAWRWASDRWGKNAVTQANGKECIENPGDGSRWLVRSQDGVYGYDAGLGVVDEAWDVKPDTVTEGLEPALLERRWSQLHITSTAHRRASSLMKSKIAAALAEDDGRTLLLYWGALPQDNPADPETWRKASPHWTEDRRRMIAAKYDRAVLGEEDPQADDPDPMEGFRAQYLNVWSLSAAAPVRGTAVIDRAAWDELTVPVPGRDPQAVAVESWFDAGVAVAWAWTLDDGAAAVHVVECADLAAARAELDARRWRGRVTVGAGLADEPELRGLALDPTRGRVLAAILDLGQLLRDGQFAHTGADVLTRQVLAARTVPGADGPRLASQGRADALKAAAWAAATARAKPRRTGRLLVVTASK